MLKEPLLGFMQARNIIVDKFVVNDLSDKADWLLSAVVIDDWHVDIINE
jgi:hypothetical protein